MFWLICTWLLSADESEPGRRLKSGASDHVKTDVVHLLARKERRLTCMHAHDSAECESSPTERANTELFIHGVSPLICTDTDASCNRWHQSFIKSIRTLRGAEHNGETCLTELLQLGIDKQLNETDWSSELEGPKTNASSLRGYKGRQEQHRCICEIWKRHEGGYNKSGNGWQKQQADKWLLYHLFSCIMFLFFNSFLL